MPGTSTRIDWLSFTLPMELTDLRTPKHGLPGEYAEWLEFRLGRAFRIENPVGEKGRFPYMASVSGNGVRLFYSPGDLDVLVEISGEGCERLEALGALEKIVEDNLRRLTRVDLATDIQTETDPVEFTENRSNKRHKSHETAISSTGTTVYIGSRKSDRYVRVYRYAKPHPRSDRLRVECVFRGHQAIALATTWLECGNDETAARAGNQYGWTHPDWTPKSTERIEAWRPDRKEHNTIHWYHSQIVPALKKLIKGGHLTLEQLLEDCSTPTNSP